MRKPTILLLTALIAANTSPVLAQMERNQSETIAPSRIGKSKPNAQTDCREFRGSARDDCLETARQAERKGPSGVSAGDAKLINETGAAAQAKLAVNDFVGAIAIYDKAIASAAKSPVRHHLYLGLATTLRRQGVVAYNTGEPSYPPEGSSNFVIQAANQANARLMTQKVANAEPLLKRALDTAAQAAALAEVSKDRTADQAIGLELRESAGLLYRIDRAGMSAAPRASVDIEAKWLRMWLTGPTAPAANEVAKYGIPVAAALTVKDPMAGLALADQVQAKTGTDADGAIGYAEIVVAAKVPAADPHRAKALAGLNAAEASVVQASLRDRLKAAKVALSGAA